MCECLRGIFRVSWTLTSHADSDREDRHGNTEAKDSPINNKRRPPPSDKPGTHLSAHHGTSPDEQDSPERIVQKEKLHAELKQVLSQKRNQLRDIQSNLINMDEPPQMDRKNEVEKDNQLSELVEVVVETQAEVGASGYSVVGGGERGIFVKEVLKDSPAAKHLSLQKGDQLLSARVYFDNVKYEDALKILQCAEPYKVSFFLKRTVPESEVSIHPSAQNLELRGPKAKMQRMSVKSVKPFKAKKRRGGRFGLKRLKENKKARDWAELDIEGSSGGPDLNPVDVEFVFPKFKVKKGGKATAVDSRHLEGVIASRKKRKIRFPKMKAKDAAVDKGDFDVDVSVHEGEDSGAKVKAKAKGPKFAMSFPRLKKSKLDVQSSNDSFEVKQQDVTCKPPTVENTYSMSQHEAKTVLSNIEITEEEKVEGSEIKLSKTNIFVSETKMSIPKFKLPKVRLSCHSDEIDGDTRMQTDLTETKTKYDTPKISLHGLTRDPKENVGDDVDGAMVKEHKISLPKSDINIPRIEVPDVDIDLSKMAKTETKTDFPKVTLEEHGAKAGKFHKPNVSISLLKITEEKQYGIDISPPHGGESVNVKENCGKGGKFEMPKLKPAITGIKIEGKEMPEIDVQLPKLKYQTGEMNLERPEIKGGRFNMPSIDISLPRREAESEVDIEGHPGIGRKIEMPRLDFSLPKIEQPVGEIHVESAEIKGGKFQKPTVEMSLPSDGVGVEAEHTGKGGRFVMPKFDVSLPKLKPPGGQFNIKDPEIKGGKFHMPSVDISLPRGGSKCDIDIKGDDKKGKTIDLPKIDDSVPKLTPSPAEIKIEGPETVKGKYDMPEIDVTLPKLKPLTGEINMEGHEIKGGKFHIPSLDISVPKGGEGRGKVIEGHAAKGGRFVMPKFDVSLPKLNASDGEFNNKDPEIKGVKLKMPSVDISLPRGGASGDVDIKGDAAKGGKFEMPKIDISLPKVKPPSVEHNIEGPDIKGGKFHMPSVDISLPRGGASGDVDIKGDAAKGGKFEMPKIDISLPKVKPPSGELSIEGPDIKGGRFHMPSVDISLPRGGASSDIDIKGDAAKIGKFEMPKVDISLPKVKPPSGELSIEGPDIKGGKFHIPSVDISLPKGGATGDVDIKGDAAKGGKFEMPKIDISLPKVKPPSETPEINVDDKEIKHGKFNMPSRDIFLLRGADANDDFKKRAGKEGPIETTKFDASLPAVDVSLPKININERETKFGPDKDFSVPKMSFDAGTKHSKKRGEINIPEVTLGGNIKLPTVKMPTVDISAPKVDLDFSLAKVKAGDRESVELLKAEGGRPSSGTSFDVPDVSVKMPKILLPKFGRKVKGERAKLKDVELESKGKVKMPEVELSLPTTNIPECEVLLPKAEVDVSEADIRDYEGSLKIPKIPTIDISVPKVDLDVSLPRVKLNEPIDLTSSDFNRDKGKGTTHFSHFKIPKVDLSFPHVTTGDVGINEMEIGKRAELRKPDVEISLPRGKNETSKFDVEILDEKTKQPKVSLPKVDISLHHGKTKEADAEIGIHGSKVKMQDIKGPEIDVSLTHGIKGGQAELTGDTVRIPKVDIPLPKTKSQDLQPCEGKSKAIPEIKPTIEKPLPQVKMVSPDHKAHGKEGKFKAPDIKTQKVTMPKVDISLPYAYGKTGELEASGSMEVQHEHEKVPDVSLSKGGIEVLDTKTIGAGVCVGKLTTTKGKSYEPDVSVAQVGFTDTDIEHKKLKMPAIEIEGQELDLGLAKKGKKNKKIKKNDLSDKEGTFTVPKEKIKGPKLKGSKFNIGMPKVKVSAPEMDNNKSGKAGADANIRTELQAPKIPELDFDIDTTKVEAGSPEEDKQKKLKIQKFGIPLPSLTSPEVNIKSSQLKGPSLPDMEYVGPSIPKVTKAVFVMVNPQIENPATIASAEIGQAEKFKQPNIKMKTSFGKSPDKGKTLQCEEEVETEAKSKPGKLKLPKVTFSPGQRGSFDVTPTGSDDSTSPGQNDDEKAKFGKLKLPKVEFFSPYSKDSSVVEEMEINTRKETSWEFKESKETKTKSAALSFTGLKTNSGEDDLVSSKARTEMLGEREGSESPETTVSAGFFSVKMNEEREETTWFKVPKVTLSPHSTGILHITPESSPKAIKSTLPGMSDEATGGFYVKMPSLEFLTHEMSSEQKTTRMEETHTVVTKTTKYKESKSSRSKE
ncbi:hypothetical protein DNTS_027597 [Danionella cerebrum]|uniref:Periaxin n=1 Tax=Danionella cerebrum TaxID=2873325 RepID=A0A553QWT8_9TELE|nr:hypothetical protein DNTS_027597 [Danionella translucida]